MIPSGYKQTEIGVIPEDWNAIPIGEFLDFKNGLNKGKEYFGYGTPIVNYTDTYKKRALKRKDIEGRVSLSKEEIRRFEARQYDVFFTRTSETPDEVGLSSVLLDEIDDCVFSGFILRGRPKNNLLDPLYCKYCFSTKEVRTSIITGCTYTTRALTNGKQLSGINILVPPLAEQMRIAEALSDVDELIASLEKLIEKKKALKQGVMQELLTGKRRLPGFTGKWVEISFESIYSYAKEGGTPSTSNELYYKNGGIPFIKIEDLAMKYIDTGTTYITNEGIEHSSAWIIPANSVILSNGATIGEVSINRIPVATKQGILGIIPDVSIDIEFLYYLFSTTRFRDDVKRITTHGTMDCAYLKDLNTIRLFIPSDKNEQIKISSILSDIDNEIVVKERELQKYRRLKSGMMSELLTGRIRLV